jgi:O-methyltransferase
MDVFKLEVERPFGSTALLARRLRYLGLYRRFSRYTMIKRSAFWRNLELAWRFRNVPGCVIECGVWRGGMSASLASVLGAHRTYYLFDSFEGLPPPKEIDGQAANDWSQRKHPEWFYDNCRAEENTAAEAMAFAGVTSPKLVKGWFDKTLPGFTPTEPIALLRLDGDWYDSTMCCLQNLFQYVQDGGAIIIDDYFQWDGCTRAVHDFLSKNKRPEPIRQFKDQIAYIIKR